MRRDVFFVLAAWGDTRRDAALATVQRTLERLFPGRAPRGVVVDNALDSNLELELDAATTCIGGDNRSREFSAWDRGLRWLDGAFAVRPDSVLLLANDTLQREGWREYLEYIRPARVHRGLAAGGLVGRTDAYPREVELFGLRLSRWVCSALVLAKAGVVERLRPFALPFPDEQIFAPDAHELFRQPSPLSPTYLRYLQSWLLGEASELRERWHSAAPLTSSNAGALRAKARSILCEHHLSARALTLGVPLFDAR